MTHDPNDTDIHGNVTGANINFGTQNFYGPVSNIFHPDTLANISIESIIEAFNSATARLANIRGTFAQTEISIKRRDVQKILDWVSQSPSNQQEFKYRLALITGKPGQGKSVVMQQLALVIRDAGYTILGIKADDLSTLPQPLLSLSDLQTLLQLPAPVEQCVRKIAEDNPCVVIIDQLDTLALTLNTNEQSLRVVVNLIDRLREIPNVKIIVSCRDFERMNDPVLGGIKIDHSFPIEVLHDDEVNHVLQQLSQPPLQQLPRPLQRLLKTPLYLDIYAQLVLSGESTELAQITTLQDLYRRLWSLRIERTEVNAPSPAERRQAVYHLVELMAQQRKLKLNISSLDEYPAVRQYLQRTGFIQEDGNTLSFLHQTLFSYCYARKFVSEQRSISNEVFASPQGFFERQLIVEIIQHLRSADLDAYHQEIAALIYPPENVRLRYHLRLLLLKWLAWQTDPTDQEYSLIMRLERVDLNDFQVWLRNTGSNPGWLQRLVNDIPRWLRSSDNRTIEMTIYYLGNFRDTHPPFVIAHIKPYLDRTQEWNQRIAWTLLYLKNWSDGDDAIELLMHLVRNGDVSIKAANHSLVAMAKSNAIAGCRLLKLHCELAFKTYLDSKSKQTDQYSRPFPEDALKEAADSWEVRGFIAAVSQNYPLVMLDYLFPWFINTAIELTQERESTKRYYPSNWFFNNLDESPSVHPRDGISFGEGVLRGLSYLAQTDPTAFRQKVSELGSINVRIIQQILLRAFRVNPAEYVIDIYDFLTGDNRRLQIQPDARLLAATAYHYSDQALRTKWEEFIFSLPQTEDDTEEKSLEKWRQRFHWRQADQLDFLVSIDEALLSDRARHRKYEILRLPEFENYTPSNGFRGGMTGAVEAPISSERQEKLSDDDWLRIMRRYDDETSWGKPRKRRHLLEEGVVEMSRSLTEQVKLDPERFYRLAQKFDEQVSVEYVIAIIQGFAHKDTKAAPEWMFNLFRRFHSRIIGHSRVGVGNALSIMDSAEVPDDIIDILVTWAKDDPDPDCEEERARMSEILSHTTPHSDGLINRAINSVRSSALEDACRILFDKEPIQLERIYEIIQRGVNDDCASVRTMAVQQLARWHDKSREREKSIRLLETAIMGQPILLTAYPVHRYLNWLSFAEPKRALLYVQVMLEISHENTQYMAAQLICVAGLYEKGEFGRLASDLHKHENPVVRRGAAVIYAQEISKSEKTTICCERLLILMEDENEQVRIQTTSCFSKLQGEHLLQLQNFFRQFIKTPALQHGGDNFIDYLTRIGIVTPEEQHLSLSLVKDLLDEVGTDIGNYNRGFLTLQSEMTLFLRNLYDKTIDQQLRESIMDLFDTMLRQGSDEAHKMLQSEDAEWMPRLQSI